MKAILRASDFKKIVSNTKRFTANRTNKLMQYIYLEVDAEAGKIKATAVDGYSVAVEYADLVDADESFKCFIKPSIPKIVKSDIYAELELVDGKAFVTVGESIVGYIQPEGEYFNLDKMFKDLEETTPAASIWVDVTLLKKALEITGLRYGEHIKIELRSPEKPISITTTRRNSKDIRLVLPVRHTEG